MNGEYFGTHVTCIDFIALSGNGYKYIYVPFWGPTKVSQTIKSNEISVDDEKMDIVRREKPCSSIQRNDKIKYNNDY